MSDNATRACHCGHQDYTHGVGAELTSEPCRLCACDGYRAAALPSDAGDGV